MASNMWQRLMKIFSVLLLLQLHGVLGKGKVIVLDEDNWEEMLTDEWMVEFYAPWCPACKALQPVWERFANSGGKLKVRVGQVDVTSSPGLSGRFMVTALPTIYHVLNGEFRQYRGARDEDAFASFVKDRKWKSVDAIPSWKSPGSLQMSVVSYFFKLSQILRSVHNNLMEEYGLPTWGSYLIFAVATIFVGALLGLLLVCVIDLIYPPKPLPPRVHASHSVKEGVALIGEGDGPVCDDDADELDGDDQDDLVDESAEGADGESAESDVGQGEGEDDDEIPDEVEIEVKDANEVEIQDQVAAEEDEEDDDNEDDGTNLRKRKTRKAD